MENNFFITMFASPNIDIHPKLLSIIVHIIVWEHSELDVPTLLVVSDISPAMIYVSSSHSVYRDVQHDHIWAECRISGFGNH